MIKKEEREAMLYFLYNKEISVMVAHNLDEGDFILHVPFFPLVHSLQDYTPEICS